MKLISDTITPRVFATRRMCKTVKDYEFIANLIKRYGCPVSKVSDMFQYSGQGGVTTVIYFDIPIMVKEQFEKEEMQNLVKE